MGDYIDLTEKQKEKLIQCFQCYEPRMTGYVYVPHEQSRGNGYMLFVFKKSAIFYEADIRRIKEAARKTKTSFTIELYEGDWISVLYFATFQY